MNMTNDQLASRLRSGGGCDDRACTVEIMTKSELGYGPESISPHDMIIKHVVTKAENAEDRFHSHIARDLFPSLLDDDDLEGLTRRMHLMDHIRAEHAGEPMKCDDCSHPVDTSHDDEATIIVTVIMPKGGKDPSNMTKSDAIEMIKKLAEKDKDFGAKLREYFRQN